MAGFFIGSAVSPAPHQVPAGSTPERNRSVHQKGCDLVNVEGNTAQGNTHNTTSFKPMNNINLNSRDQVLALAMDPGQSAFTFSEEDFDDDAYDIVLCAGVFTLGHVFPSALIELVYLTKPGGILITSTRKRYADEARFGNFCEHLESEGRISILDVNKNAPYIAEEAAHYWALQVH